MSQPFTIDPEPAVGARSGGGLRAFGRMWPATLTGRLVVGVVGLITALVVLVGVATYAALAPFLTARLDDQLNVVSQQSNLIRFLNYAQNPQAPPPAAQNAWFTAMTTSGVVLVTVPDDLLIHPLNLSAADRRDLSGDPGRVRTVTTTDGSQLRVIAVGVNIATRSSDGVSQTVPGVLVVGLSTHDVQDTLHRLLLLELVLGAAAVAVAAGLTSIGVRRGLRPLRRVARTAQEVTAELGPEGSGLDRRVPVTDSAATEVAEVTASVNTLLQAVETEFIGRVRSERRMRQFLADASHELRTPLTSIRGYAELARLRSRGGQACASEEADDSMHRIEIEGTRMSRLVEDLLVLARGDQGTSMQREPIEVDQLLTEAAGAVRSAHPERVLQVIPSGGAVVIGDRDQLLRVLLNLATNAAVHTPPTGPIRLVAETVQLAQGGTVALRVIDAGPGLPPEEAAHVFERFWRADKARSRAKGGSGLGMAIVAQIVQAHGGSVHFDSSVESGTTVTVLLPAARPHDGPPVRSPGTAPAWVPAQPPVQPPGAAPAAQPAGWPAPAPGRQELQDAVQPAARSGPADRGPAQA